MGFISKAKSFVSRCAGAIVGAVAAVSATAIAAFAETGTVDYSTVTSSLSSGLSDVIDNVMSVGATVIPIAIGIFGTVMIVKFGKKFFSSVTGG